MAKSKKVTGKKYYISSEVLDSSHSVGFIKERFERERATYRREVPTVAVDPEDLKDAQEVTKTKRKMVNFSEEGELDIIEVDVTQYDILSWRYYFIPKTLDELEQFVFGLGLEVGMTFFDPGDCDEDEEGWIEGQIGMPVPEEKAVILQIKDSFMLQDMEGECCSDPNCKSCNSEEEEESEE